METDIELAYNEYKSNFDSNTLYTIPIDTKFSTIREELLSLYDYQNKIVRNIRENINNQQLEAIRNTCQNCTIDSVGTMDHILPKTSYPEYAVNAYNLFPCCSKCNQYKFEIIGK
jgi:5-methylcytosine-specific restriction endonuclease McrA